MCVPLVTRELLHSCGHNVKTHCLAQEEAEALAAKLGAAAPATQDGQGVSPGSGCVLSGESAARMTQGLPPLEKVGQQ